MDMTLAELLTAREMPLELYDAFTGERIAEDSPEQYAVLEVSGDTAIVRGPSGDTDEADLTDGCRLRRNV